MSNVKINQPQTAIAVETPAVTEQVVTAQTLRDILLTAPSGNTFISIEAVYDMNDKGKMKKTGNPFIGQNVQNVQKHSKTSVMVNFSYEKSMENRGDESKKVGNWAMPVKIDGKFTPLSVHRKDVNKVDEDGNAIDLNDNANIYLRGEDRGTKSVYKYEDGTDLTADEVATLKTFLPKRQPQTVAFRLIGLNNIKSLTMNGVKYKLVK